jgi:hypothetical protein
MERLINSDPQWEHLDEFGVIALLGADEAAQLPR